MNDVHVREAEPGDRDAVSALLARAALIGLDDAAQFGSQYAVASVN
jgi:hypothetical protein